MNALLTSLVLLATCCALTAAYAASADIAATSKRCMDNSRSCSSASECCSGCCNRGACDSPDRCTAMSQGACAVHYCPPDKECYLQVVQCITAPCPPIPGCRPKNADDYDNYD